MQYPTPAPTGFKIGALIDDHLHLAGPLLLILNAIQAAFAHVPASAISVIAKTLNITKAEVHGVVSFNHDFRDAAAGRHLVKICRTKAW